IALKSDLPRTLVYDILERLIDFGLISYCITQNKKHFTAANPQELLRILKDKETAVRSALPQLDTLYSTKGVKRPKVQIYEGNEGMKNVMDDILRSGVKIFIAYGSSRSSFEVIPAFMEEWHNERIKKKVIMRILYNNTREAREKLKSRTTSLAYTQHKFMPIQLESPTATLIYSNKVVLQSWTKEPFAVMIESEDMARNQKEYFEELWKIAK
ncbi:MAG: hypothetical protein KJ574_03600, partial [Nanoarchaeota archaeon]|nr:hypothetical protein [Nanoarchaeota archaeon]